MKATNLARAYHDQQQLSDTVLEGWAEAKLGEIVSPSKERIEPARCPDAAYLSLEHVESHTARILGQGCAREVKSTKAVFQSGDVIYGKLRPYLNKVSIPHFGGVCSTDLLVFRKSSWLENRFLLWFLLRTEVVEFANHRSTGVQLPRVKFEALAELDFPLPPLAEQKRIVENVEQLLGRVNAVRERLARVTVMLKHFRQAVLAAGCSGRFTADWRARTPVEQIEKTLERVKVPPSKTGREATDNIIPGFCILSVGNPGAAAPSGWRWTPLTEIAKLESGHTPSRKHPEYWGGKIQWIGILDAGAHHGRVIQQTIQTVTDLGIANSAARLLPPRTVCLSRTASVGYVLIMGREMATSQDFVNWVCSEALVPEFLMYALMAEGEDIKRFGRGSTHTTIYFPEVKALHICLPPVGEQREIIRRIEESLTAAGGIQNHIAVATARAEKLTQAILGKAFRGELVPTEAELARREGRSYEPASVLLDRIRAEREASTPPTKAGLARRRRGIVGNRA